MKTAFIFLILFLSANGLSAQPYSLFPIKGEEKEPATIDTTGLYKETKLLEQKQLFFHDFGAVYIGSNYNDVGNQLSLFLQMKMELNLLDTRLKGNDIILSYESGSGKLKLLNVSFSLDNNQIIKSIKITGNADLVILLFVKYWATQLDFDDVKQNTFVKCNYWGDLIELKTTYISDIDKICYITITAQE